MIDDASCRRLLFGVDRDQEGARALLNERLKRLIALVTDACRPTAEQQSKLELAGRTDISRFFKRADELRARLTHVYDVLAARRGELDDALDRLLPQARALRRILDGRDFGEDSLFAKTLRNILTAEQLAAYEAAEASDPPRGHAPGQKAESAPKPEDK